MDSIANPNVKTSKGERIGARYLVRNISRVEGHVGALGWGLGRLTNDSILTRTYINQTTSWLVRSSNTLVHRRTMAKHRLIRLTTVQIWGGSHHHPLYNILFAWPWDQHPNVILSQDSQMGVLKFPNLGLSQLWGPIILCVDLQLK
jgi:hypothetical protein